MFKRRNFLINPKFQLRFSIYITLIVTITSIAFPLSIFDTMSVFESSTSLVIEQLNQCESMLNANLHNQVQGKENPLIQSTMQQASIKERLGVILVVWQIAFSLLIFIYGVFFSHKIAGPLYKLKKTIGEAISSQKLSKIYFRKGDYFQEIAQSYNEFVEFITNKQKQNAEDLEKLQNEIRSLDAFIPEAKRDQLKKITDDIENLIIKFKT